MKKSLVKNILVTGGAGFIGSHLIDRLFADVSRAKSRLDYMPKISIEDGIYRFVNWYETMMESNGKLFS